MFKKIIRLGAVSVFMILAGFLVVQAAPSFVSTTSFPGSGIWNSAGRVGIGTTNPSYKLDVAGNGSFSSNLTFLNREAPFVVNDPHNAADYYKIATFTTTSGYGNDDYEFRLIERYGVSTLRIHFNNYPAGIGYLTNFTLSTQSGSNNERLFMVQSANYTFDLYVLLNAWDSLQMYQEFSNDQWNSPGTYVTYYNNKVGLPGGSTEASYRLYEQGDIVAGGGLSNSSFTTHTLLGNAGNVVVMADNTGTLYSTPLATFASTNSLWGGTKNGNIWNGDAGAGSVGIGTTNPSVAALQVNISSGINLDLDKATGAYLAFSKSNTIAGSISGMPSNDGLQFNYGSGNTTAMTINGSGNVGIEATNPGSNLEVGGTASAPSLTAQKGIVRLAGTGATGIDMGVMPASPWGGWIQSSNNPISIGGAYPLLLNPLGGNVGIGTTNPLANLVVNAATPDLRLTTSGDQNNGLDIVANSAYDSIQQRYGYPLSLQPTSGNVGIGTTNPTGILSVASTDAGSFGTTTWNSGYSVFGPNSGSTTGAALALGYSNANGAYIDSLAPNVIWEPMTLGAYTFSFLSRGAIQGIAQDINGHVGIGITNPGNVLQIYTSNGSSGLQTGLICSNGVTSKLYTDGSGNIICGTDTASGGNGNIIDTLSATLGAGNDAGAQNIVNVGYASIGTASVGARLNVNAAMANATPVASITNTGSGNDHDFYGLNVTGAATHSTSGSSNSYAVYIQPGAASVTPNASYGLYVAPGSGSGASYSGYFGGDVAMNGNVGIGTTNLAGYKLNVNGTAYFNGNITVGDGLTSKINVGTVDPVYTIGGQRYATYGLGMTGVKEETAGVWTLACIRTVCSRTVDFDDLAAGSDLWLFAQATDLRHNFAQLAVLLSPGFAGQAWYEKDIARHTLTIKAVNSGAAAPAEVSYRLTAPRFDYQSWPNTSTSSDEGFNLDKVLR